MILFLNSDYVDKQPFVSMTWHTPDGREIRIGDVTPNRSDSFRFGQDAGLTRRLDGLKAETGLFIDPDASPPRPLEGTYRLDVEGLLFEPGTNLEAKLVVYGEVHGLAGTDHQRRDLMVALMWGTPIAMAFGLLAAVGTTVTTMAIAAIGVWFGGWLDEAIQRITEVNLILPLLPILIMIGTFYSRSIWVMLGVVILLSIFGASIKSYRAIFLQVRTLPYIEAAQAYGASNMRIIFRYLVPRILPLVIPSLVILVPSFVFLEASLAVLGLGDPVLPTWGKVIQDANSQGALFNGYYYWLLEPAALLMVAGLAFAMVGFALDRVFNPRLREL
jgi:peptide/nickel transport system permease protein